MTQLIYVDEILVRGGVDISKEILNSGIQIYYCNHNISMVVLQEALALFAWGVM